MSTTARIVVADTNPMFADGIVACLGDAGYTVLVRTIGEQHDVPQIVNDDTDVLLLGPTRTTEHRCFALCRQATQVDQHVRVIISTPYIDDELLCADAVFSGASACLSTEASCEEVRATVDAVLADHTLFSPEITAFAFATEALTSRENEVLNRMPTDLTYSEIAVEFGVSLATVKSHVQRIFEKLAVDTRETAVRRAYRRGIISPSN